MADRDQTEPGTGQRGSLTSTTQRNEFFKRFDRIVRGSSFGMWEFDVSQGMVYLFGNFWEKISHEETGYRNRVSIAELGERFYPGDWESIQAKINSLTIRQPDFKLQTRFIRKDNTALWTQIDSQGFFDESGELCSIAGVAFEITELKNTETLLRESEERHARILSATSDGIWEWSAEGGGFHFSSRCWEHLDYYEDDDEMLDGRNRLEVWRERIHPDDLIEFDRQMQGHLKNQMPFDVEYRIAAKDGSWRWIRARGQASFNEEGRAVRMSGTNMDITSLKDAEEKVLKAKELAEKANQAKSEFLSSMSHELRTPLNAILGYAQLFLIDPATPQEKKENALEIQRAGEHLLELINDVLDLSKIETGKMSMSVEPVEPLQIIRECIRLLNPLVTTRSIKLWMTTNGLEHIRVKADATRLKQAMLNLISNACKYNHEGGEVEIIFSKQTPSTLRMEVRDAGFGIPEVKQSEVFEPFNRLGAEGSSIEGSGVGLVITKRLINMMGGRLSFWSREGAGSRFWVDLTCFAENGRATEAEAVTQAVIPPRLLGMTAHKRILYVEDNPSNIRVMEQMFKPFKRLELLTAKEAFYGVFLARTELPDLIILDINLPGMDGYEALSVLKQDPLTSTIPVIALTANVMAYDIERGRAAGFDEYLTKPIDMEQLFGVFEQLLLGSAED